MPAFCEDSSIWREHSFNRCTAWNTCARWGFTTHAFCHKLESGLFWKFRPSWIPIGPKIGFSPMSFFKNCNLIFPYVFSIEWYYSLIIFKEIFTRLLVISKGIHLEISNFLRFSFTSIGISWWRIFFDQLYHLATIGCQSVVSRGKIKKIASFLAPLTTLWQHIVAK